MRLFDLTDSFILKIPDLHILSQGSRVELNSKN